MFQTFYFYKLMSSKHLASGIKLNKVTKQASFLRKEVLVECLPVCPKHMIYFAFVFPQMFMSQMENNGIKELSLEQQDN
jgi:hypothetical protein